MHFEQKKFDNFKSSLRFFSVALQDSYSIRFHIARLDFFWRKTFFFLHFSKIRFRRFGITYHRIKKKKRIIYLDVWWAKRKAIIWVLRSFRVKFINKSIIISYLWYFYRLTFFFSDIYKSSIIFHSTTYYVQYNIVYLL